MASFGNNYPNLGPSQPPKQSPNFSSGQNPQGLGKLIALVIAVGLGIFVYSASQSNWKDFGSQFDQFNKFVSKSLNDLDSPSSKLQSVKNSKTTDKDTLNKKLNAYVALLNYVSENVYSSYDRYLQWVDLDLGITGKETHVYGLYNLIDYKFYFDQAQKAFILEPEIALDQDYLKYVESYLVLKPLVDEAYAYYDQKDYQDDNFEKAKLMHPKLLKAYQDFEQISVKLSQDFEIVDLELRKNEIAQYQVEGRTIALNTAKSYQLAQSMFIQIREDLAQNNNDANKIDSVEFKAKLDQYEELYKVLKSQKESTEDIKTEYGITGNSLYSSYLDNNEKLIKASKSLYRAIKNKQVPERNSFGKYTDGTPENYIYVYNQLVNSFNSLNRI